MRTHKNKAKTDDCITAKNILYKYQTLCENRRKSDEESRTFFGIMKQARGNWQESIRKKNEADKELMDFHIKLKK